MNKKFLTLAVSAALVGSGAALADVTVYGKIRMSLDYTDSNTDPADPATERKGNLSVANNSSYIGFKGSEDLGGGLKGIWQIESNANIDEKKGDGVATRDSYLGLNGGFGTVLMGKHDTPFKLLGGSLDPFRDTIADTRQLLGDDDGRGIDFDIRAPNVVAYITPNFNGFSAILAYVTGAKNDDKDRDNNKLDAFSLNATYRNGPVYVGAAYETHSKEIAGAPKPGSNSPSAWRVGGSVELGAAKIGAMYEQLNDADSIDAQRSGGTLFGTYTFGAETIKLAYTMAGKWEVGGTEIDESGASLFAIGLDHAFSKRTKGYVQYVSLTNEDASGYTLGGIGTTSDPVTPGPGKDPSAFSVGLIHSF